MSDNEELRSAAAKEVDRWEQAISDELTRLFDRMEAVTLARLQGTKARKHTRHWTPAGDRPLEVKAIIDPARWIKDAAGSLAPVVGRLYAQVYGRVAKALGKEPAEGDPPADDPVPDAVKARLDLIATGVQTAIGEVEDYIEKEEAAGTPMPQIASGVKALYAARKPTWAARIATVSAVGSINQAALFAAADAKSSAKQWLSRRDPLVRDTHEAADGQVRLLDERFRLGGIPSHPKKSLLMFPGDPGPDVPLDEIMNCRCTMLFSPPRQQAKGFDVDDGFLEALDRLLDFEVKDRVATAAGVAKYHAPIGTIIISHHSIPVTPRTQALVQSHTKTVAAGDLKVGDIITDGGYAQVVTQKSDHPDGVALSLAHAHGGVIHHVSKRAAVYHKIESIAQLIVALLLIANSQVHSFVPKPEDQPHQHEQTVQVVHHEQGGGAHDREGGKEGGKEGGEGEEAPENPENPFAETEGSHGDPTNDDYAAGGVHAPDNVLHFAAGGHQYAVTVPDALQILDKQLVQRQAAGAVKDGGGLEVKDTVRTPGGARHYGQPIGTTIVPNAATVPSFSARGGSVGATPVPTTSGGVTSSHAAKPRVISRFHGGGRVEVAGEDPVVRKVVAKYESPAPDPATTQVIVVRDKHDRIGAYVVWQTADGPSPKGTIVAVSVSPHLRGHHVGDQLVQLAAREDPDLIVTSRPAPPSRSGVPGMVPSTPVGPPQIRDRRQQGDAPGPSGDFDTDAARIERLQKAYLRDRVDTESLYAKGGRFSRAREKQQQAIIDHFVNQPGVKADGKLLIVGGMPGSGKTTTLNSPVGKAALGVDTADYVTVNSDEVKAEMIKAGMVPDYPGLSPQESMSLIQAESYEIAQGVMRQAAAKRLNFAYDCTLRTSGQMGAPMGAVSQHSGGYETTLVLVDVPLPIAEQRARARYEAGDRYVPMGFIDKMRPYRKGSTSLPAENFEAMKGSADKYLRIDNAGATPVVVDQGFSRRRARARGATVPATPPPPTPAPVSAVATALAPQAATVLEPAGVLHAVPESRQTEAVEGRLAVGQRVWTQGNGSGGKWDLFPGTVRSLDTYADDPDHDPSDPAQLTVESDDGGFEETEVWHIVTHVDGDPPPPKVAPHFSMRGDAAGRNPRNTPGPAPVAGGSTVPLLTTASRRKAAAQLDALPVGTQVTTTDRGHAGKQSTYTKKPDGDWEHVGQVGGYTMSLDTDSVLGGKASVDLPPAAAPPPPQPAGPAAPAAPSSLAKTVVLPSAFPPVPAGARVYAHPQGKHIYLLPDGSMEVYKPNGKRATSSATPQKLAAGYGGWVELTDDSGGTSPAPAAAPAAAAAKAPTLVPNPTVAPVEEPSLPAPTGAMKIVPMDFNEAALSDVPKYVADPKFWFQQKVDGIRGVLMVEAGKTPWFASKKGDLLRSATAAGITGPILAKLPPTPAGSPSYRVEGELLNGKWNVFDMTVVGQESMPYEQRQAMAKAWTDAVAPSLPQVVALPTAKTADEKQALWDQVLRSGAEGVMMKNIDAPYNPGARVSHTLKAKVTATADVVVISRNVGGKDNAEFGMMKNGKVVSIGTVSTGGKDKALGQIMPGDVVEVEYLWASADEKLTQPRIIRKRPDKTANDATDVTQLRFVDKAVLALSAKHARLRLEYAMEAAS